MEGQEEEPRPGLGSGNTCPTSAGAHWGRAYPVMDSGSSMKTRARAETGCSSCSLILACGQGQVWATGTDSTSRGQGRTLILLPLTSPTPALPGLRGQQQLHLQLRGLNGDP